MEYTEAARSPELYKKAAGVFCVAAALTRRCWSLTDQGRIYPGMMMILVGESGTGKSPVIVPVESLLRHIDWSDNPARMSHGIRLGASRLTESALFEFLASARSIKTYKQGKTVHQFSNGVFIAEEAGTLFTELRDKHAAARFGGRLIECLDARDAITRSLKSDESDISVVLNPSISILVGLQTELVYEFFPESTWHQGFTPRALFVFGEPPSDKGDIFSIGDDIDLTEQKAQRRDSIESKLKKDLESICRLSGQFVFETAAKKAINKWYDGGRMRSAPDHPSLKTYKHKRPLHLIRIAMAMSAAKHDDLIVTEDDTNEAIRFLEELESVMPRIFDETANKESDSEVIKKMLWLIRAYCLKNNNPAPEALVRAQLAKLVYAERVDSIIGIMLDSGSICRVKLSSNITPGPYGKTGFSIQSTPSD